MERRYSMNILICDDDERDILKLRKMIEEYGRQSSMEVNISEFVSGKDMLKAISSTKIDKDAIFLDINMNDMDGLSVAKQIREKDEEVPIILVTAYMNYALDGYKVRASRFLIKDDLDKTLTECMDSICHERKKSSKILFSCVGGDVYLKLSDIRLIETSGHKNTIWLEKESYQIYKKMDDLAMQLKGYGFLRIHKSFLVNMEYIRQISNYILTMEDGRQLPIPKAKYKQVRQEYTLFVGEFF